MSGQTRVDRTLPVLAGLMAYWGFVEVLNAAAAPFLSREFGLDDAAIARTFGWMAVGALGTYPLARAADRIGRRRILLVALLGLSPLALASALAPDLLAYVLAQVGATALRGVLVVVIPVMVAEALPLDRRARGQGVIGLTGALGSGLALLVVPLVAGLPGGWRWAWALAVFGLVGVPFARRALPESAHFERADAAGETRRARARDLLGPRYRTRALATVAIALIFPMVMNATQVWVVYHPVQNLGLDPWIATAIALGGGACGLVGYPLAGRLCETWGRRPTFALAGTLYPAAVYAFYHVPADLAPHPALGLAASFGVAVLLSSALSVPMRAAATELFPTALRATLSGWGAMALAAGTVIGFFATSALAGVLGGIADAASVMGLALLVAVVIFLAAVPEFRGRELEAGPASASGPRAEGGAP